MRSDPHRSKLGVGVLRNDMEPAYRVRRVAVAHDRVGELRDPLAVAREFRGDFAQVIRVGIQGAVLPGSLRDRPARMLLGVKQEHASWPNLVPLTPVDDPPTQPSKTAIWNPRGRGGEREFAVAHAQELQAAKTVDSPHSGLVGGALDRPDLASTRTGAAKRNPVQDGAPRFSYLGRRPAGHGASRISSRCGATISRAGKGSCDLSDLAGAGGLNRCEGVPEHLSASVLPRLPAVDGFSSAYLLDRERGARGSRCWP